MSRLSSALGLLAAGVVIGGCGASVATRSLSAARAGSAAQTPTGTVASSVTAVVSALARSEALATPGAAVGPVITPSIAAPVAAAHPAPSTTGPRTAVGALPARADPIVALGDSLTFGWGKGASPTPFGPAPAHSYPWYVEHDLGVPVVNAGVSGATAREVLDPASEPHDPRPPSLQLPALLALHPRLVVLSFGTNEVQRGWPVSQAAADLDRVLARIRAAGVPIVLVGTHVDCVASPCGGPAPGYTRQRYLSNWDDALTALATRYEAGLVLDVERNFTPDDLTDWIHPTAWGYWRMAQRIEPAIVSVLQRQSSRTHGGPAAPRLPAGGGWTPPAAPPPEPGPREPRPQSDMWPGGPHETLPWNLDRLRSLLDESTLAAYWNESGANDRMLDEI